MSEARRRIREQPVLLYVLVVAIAVDAVVLIGPHEVTDGPPPIMLAQRRGSPWVGFFLLDSAQGARVYVNVQKNPMKKIVGPLPTANQTDHPAPSSFSSTSSIAARTPRPSISSTGSRDSFVTHLAKRGSYEHSARSQCGCELRG